MLTVIRIQPYSKNEKFFSSVSLFVELVPQFISDGGSVAFVAAAPFFCHSNNVLVHFVEKQLVNWFVFVSMLTLFLFEVSVK